MPGKESLAPQDWFRKADADIQTVEILLSHGGNMEVAAMHIQQTVEKYLKGYLLSTGWELDRIHDLPALLDEAVARSNAFEQYRVYFGRVSKQARRSRVSWIKQESFMMAWTNPSVDWIL
jgi:HEPN domain-containing protein